MSTLNKYLSGVRSYQYFSVKIQDQVHELNSDDSIQVRLKSFGTLSVSKLWFEEHLRTVKNWRDPPSWNVQEIISMSLGDGKSRFPSGWGGHFLKIEILDSIYFGGFLFKIKEKRYQGSTSYKNRLTENLKKTLQKSIENSKRCFGL